MTPLYNHTSIETSYLVADYPYGRTVRCRIRYWIEDNGKKGLRFCSQTENPKTLQWNKPKCSTYTEFAACMYLDDENGYVQWRALGQYSSAQEALAFIKDFPGADMTRIRLFAKMKVIYLQGRLDGKIGFAINGIVKPDSEYELEKVREDKKVWEEVNTLLQLSQKEHQS